MCETFPSTTANDHATMATSMSNDPLGVGVGSKFTIEECRRYAKHLQSTGQGINNPGGYATTVHRTGEADMLIESFLHAETADTASSPDTSQCLDCKGTGFSIRRESKVVWLDVSMNNLEKKGSDV